jgi:hypothetical protein
MGRPKLENKKILTSYKFTSTTLERLDKHIPSGKRGIFVENAVLQALDMLFPEPNLAEIIPPQIEPTPTK